MHVIHLRLFIDLKTTDFHDWKRGRLLQMLNEILYILSCKVLNQRLDEKRISMYFMLLSGENGLLSRKIIPVVYCGGHTNEYLLQTDWYER